MEKIDTTGIDQYDHYGGGDFVVEKVSGLITTFSKGEGHHGTPPLFENADNNQYLRE
jgi:hypothetical protein